MRLFDVTEPEMPDVGRRSRELVETEFEQITWEHSHVVVDDDGSVRTYCVYEAPTADMVSSTRCGSAARGRLDRGDRGRRHAFGLPARLTSPRWNDAWAAIARRRRMKLLRSSSSSGTSSSACAVEQRRVILRPAALRLRRGALELVDRAWMVARVAPVARDRADRLARHARRALEELGDQRVAPRALRARQQVVRDVADQDVRERELLLSLHDRAVFAPDQVSALELLQQQRRDRPARR